MLAIKITYLAAALPVFLYAIIHAQVAHLAILMSVLHAYTAGHRQL